VKLQASGVDAYGKILEKRAYTMLRFRAERWLEHHGMTRILPGAARRSLAKTLIRRALEKRLTRRI